jgi:hypothetical protein
MVNLSPLFEVNSVKFVNDPDNWTISNRDIGKLTINLLPFVSIFVLWRDVCPSEDFMVFIDTHDLAVSNRDLDELGSTHEGPATSSRGVISNVRSVVNSTIGAHRPNFTIKTNRYLSHFTLDSNSVISLRIESIDLVSSQH